MNEELLKILVCPESKQPVKLLDSSKLAELNRKIQAGGLTNKAGQRIDSPLEAALVRDDGTAAYPVRDGIPVMLIDEAFDPR